MSSYNQPRNGNSNLNTIFNSTDFSYGNSYLPSFGSSVNENASLIDFAGVVDASQQLVFNSATIANRYISNVNNIVFCDTSGTTNALLIKANGSGIVNYNQAGTSSGQQIFSCLNGSATPTTVLTLNTSTITLASTTVALSGTTAVTCGTTLANIFTASTATVNLLTNATAINIGGTTIDFTVSITGTTSQTLLIDAPNVTSSNGYISLFPTVNAAGLSVGSGNKQLVLAGGAGSGAGIYLGNTTTPTNSTLYVNCSTISSSGANTSINLFNSVQTTINFAGASTTLNLGASTTGTCTINNTTLAVPNASSITCGTGLANVFTASTQAVNFLSNATYINFGSSTTYCVLGGSSYTNASTANLYCNGTTGTLNLGSVCTTAINIGNSSNTTTITSASLALTTKKITVPAMPATSNSCFGTAQLTSGTATITTSACTTSSLVFVTQAGGGTHTVVKGVTTVSNGSFIVSALATNSSVDTTDNGFFNWFLVN